MGDEDDRGAMLLGQGVNVVEDLPLDRDIERRGGFVCHQQIRAGRHADADEHTLAHTAGELVWELLESAARIRQAGFLERLDCTRLCFFAAQLRVRLDGFANLEADAPHRVEVRHRVLRDVADFLTANVFDFPARQLREVLALEQGMSTGDFAVLGQQTEDRSHGGRFSGTGFADDGQVLAAAQFEAHTADGVDRAGKGRERDFEVFHVQQRCGICRGASGCRCLRSCSCGLVSVLVGFRHRRVLAFGSSASRTMSPSSRNARTVRARAPAG